jgi:hypothetical protein
MTLSQGAVSAFIVQMRSVRGMVPELSNQLNLGSKQMSMRPNINNIYLRCSNTILNPCCSYVNKGEDVIHGLPLPA